MEYGVIILAMTQRPSVTTQLNQYAKQTLE